MRSLQMWLVFDVFGALFNLAGVLCGPLGNPWAPYNAIGAVLCILFTCGQVNGIRKLENARYYRRLREIAQRRREWPAAVAAAEMAVYGETYYHNRDYLYLEGETTPIRPQAQDSRAAPVSATETAPASLDQYLQWLRGYVKHGGVPTHDYSYPFRQAAFQYASSTLTVNSDREYGANSRNIIVGHGVQTERTNPRGHFGGWAHTKLFFMDSYQTNSAYVVPIYSNPEFREFRSLVRQARS